MIAFSFVSGESLIVSSSVPVVTVAVAMVMYFIQKTRAVFSLSLD
jgi:hypothetical protein